MQNNAFSPPALAPNGIRPNHIHQVSSHLAHTITNPSKFQIRDNEITSTTPRPGSIFKGSVPAPMRIPSGVRNAFSPDLTN